ncbi:hypothetical protein [Hyalangium versicolor]|uniref:hypothetical protein n=1 Tax=Hyalangium versicolor TaxID=2861190 RepID=UPI001CCD607D|nr:hypothetical protein [Hyalangium versicolor]
MTAFRSLPLLLLLALLGASVTHCSNATPHDGDAGPPTAWDGGSDAGQDAGPKGDGGDAGGPPDGGTSTDAGDAGDAGGTGDGGVEDAGPGDAGSTGDGGAEDAGPGDAGSAEDGGTEDGGSTCICEPEDNAEVACVLSTCESSCLGSYSRCGDTCVTESITQCGPSCQQCYAPTNATAACMQGSCTYTCADGYHACEEGCCRFQLEKVDPRTFGGVNASIAAGSDGTLHLTYFEIGEHRLMHATYAQGHWSFEPIRRWYNTFGSFQALAMGPGNTPWVLYARGSDPGLDFVRRTPSGWVSEKVLEHTPTGTDFATDAFGHAHLCFTREDGGLAHGVRRGDRWFFQDVDTNPNAGTACAIAVDGRGRPHIAYYQKDSGDLRYAAWDGTAFQLTTVDTGGTADVGSSLALALDTRGQPRIAYYDATARDLKYAVATSGGWTVKAVLTAGNVGRNPALTLDAQGRAFISFWSESAYRVRYAREGDAGWTIGAFDAQDSATREETSVAANAQGHLFAVMGGYRDILVARNLSGDWETEQVDAQFGAGNRVTMALRGGQPIGAWLENDGTTSFDFNIKIGERTGPDTWKVTRLEGERATGVSFALDAQGNPHLAWTDARDYDLRYARRVDGVWQKQTIDTEGYTGFSPSLALDSLGRPHIAYSGPVNTNTSLKYAQWDGTQWLISAVESPSPATDIVLRLDAQDVPHLLWYTGYGTQDLRYATRNLDGWQVVTVEATGNAGEYHALTLDASGVPNACYTLTNGSTTTLRLATRGPTGWTATTVPTPNVRPNGACALAFNASGSPSILFGTLYGAGLGAMYLGTRTGSSWTSTFIEDDFYVFASALAFDSDGHPHFLYYGQPYDGSGQNPERLRYGTR